MKRERATKILMVLVGVLFVALIYPLITSVWQSKEAKTEPMMLSLYVTLGVFLLLGARNPSAHRSLIAFAAWSSFAHAAVMAVQTLRTTNDHEHLISGVALFGVVGLALMLLTPSKQAAQHASATGA